MIGPFTFAEILGAILTCIVVALTYYRSSINVRMHRTAFVAATCVVLTLLLSLRYQLLPAIQEDLALQALGNANDETRKLFTMLAEAPSDHSQPFMNYIVQSRMESLNDYYNNLDTGRFSVSPEDLPQFLLSMLNSANKEIIATSYAEPASWWNEPWGKSYEAANEAAAARKVKVTRTFLFTSQADLDAIRPLLLQEVKAGIDVKWAFVESLPPNLVNGMVVIDSGFAGKLLLTPQRAVKEADFFTQQNDIDQIKNSIDQVQLQARPLQEASRKGGGSK